MEPIDIDMCIDACGLQARAGWVRLRNLKVKGAPEVIFDRKSIGADGSLHSQIGRKIHCYKHTLESMKG